MSDEVRIDLMDAIREEEVKKFKDDKDDTVEEIIEDILLEEEEDEDEVCYDYERTTFSIPAGKDGNDRIVIWGYIPQKFNDQRKVSTKNKSLSFEPKNNRLSSGSIIMANGLALPRSAGLPHFASRFARSGFNVFLFDFRHLGDSTGLPRQIVSMISQLEDYLTVLKFVTEPESHSKLFENFIDPKKVILWGWSNSGGHVSKLATNPDLKLCGVDERFERDLHLRISGVICLDPMCDGIKNLKHHVWNNPLGLAKIGHYVLGDLIISMIPFLSKRYSINVPALGPGGFLGSEEAERGAKMIASQSSEEAEKEGEEFQNVNTMTADQTKLKKSGEKRSKLVGMQDLGPKFVNLVAARYGYDVMFQNSNGSSVNCSILVSWSKDKGDGLITDQVPRSFLNHCQKLLSQSSTKHQKTSLNDSESTTSVKEIDLNRIKRTTVEVESFEHEGDHFGLHFGGIGFEDGIKRQIEFIKKLI